MTVTVYVCACIYMCLCAYMYTDVFVYIMYTCWNWQMRTKLNEVLYFYHLLNAGFHCSHTVII